MAMRRLSVDSGNGEDHYDFHSRSGSAAATARSGSTTASSAKAHKQNGQNGHHYRTRNVYNEKKQFKSKMSDIMDNMPSPASAPPPSTTTLSRHRRRLKKGHRRQHGFGRRCCNALLSTRTISSSSFSSSSSSGMTTLALAVGLWYTLGVVSIATSKIMLLPSSRKSENGDVYRMHVSPLTLTLQQLWIGSTLLKGITTRLQPWPPPGMLPPNDEDDTFSTSKPSYHHTKTTSNTTQQVLLLRWTALCFALGFLATNFAFSGSAASFVETVKAAEPLTSATVAVAYGLETLTLPQKTSLGTIVAGVLLATLGEGTSNSTTSTDNRGTPHDSFNNNKHNTNVAALLPSAIVMTSNLFFSFRGLYQKLLRNVASTQVLDDWNLQYRMQCTGVWLLIGPVLLLDLMPTTIFGISSSWSTSLPNSGSSLLHYVVLAIVNGTAFCGYNLASTYLLTRLSVVHHAALNCLRRVFAIVVTSLLFGIPLTATKLTGIAVAVLGFWSYTHYKMMAQQQQQHKQQYHGQPPSDHQHQQHPLLLPLNGKYV